MGISPPSPNMKPNLGQASVTAPGPSRQPHCHNPGRHLARLAVKVSLMTTLRDKAVSEKAEWDDGKANNLMSAERDATCHGGSCMKRCCESEPGSQTSAALPFKPQSNCWLLFSNRRRSNTMICCMKSKLSTKRITLCMLSLCLDFRVNHGTVFSTVVRIR